MNREFPEAVKAIGVGMEIAVSVVGGGLIGYKLGEKFGFIPLGLAAGLIIGLIGAVYGTYQIFSYS
ncbi:MAG: AtpZ/AtpI family protein [Candidatus Hadarchaeia archaeon]